VLGLQQAPRGYSFNVYPVASFSLWVHTSAMGYSEGVPFERSGVVGFG
jgi:hypothetical protein